jgi:transcriptional regulator with XRE-family HTH domain
MVSRELHRRVAKNIKRFAKLRRITLSHVPDRSGMSRAQFWRILAASHSPSLRMLHRIADALEVKVEDLVREDPQDRH